MLGFTRESVERFFDLYQKEMEEYRIKPSRVFNVDETGISIVQHKHSRILSLKGKNGSEN